MKKKIKDITLKEANKICLGHTCNKNCPFFQGSVDQMCVLEQVAGFPICSSDLEKEVEVPENE